MKDKIFWFGTILVILSWIGNSLFFHSKQLEKPLFLNHYYDAFIHENSDGGNLTFYYLTNKSDSSYVSHIEVGDTVAYPMGNDIFYMSGTNEIPQYEKEFTHHYLRAVTVDFPYNLEDSSMYKLDFSKMDVFFSDGTVIHPNIGDVHINLSRPNEDVLERRISGSSSNHLSYEALYATEPLTIEEIEIPSSVDVEVKVDVDQENLKNLEREQDDPLNWNGETVDKLWNSFPGTSLTEESLPIQLKNDEWIRLFFRLEPQNKNYLELAVTLKGTTQSGEPFVREVYLSEKPNLTEESIKEIIQQKTGGDSN